MVLVGPLTAYKPDLDFDAEPEAAVEETSDTDSQVNEGQGDEPGPAASQEIPTEEIQTNSSVKEDDFGDDFEAELEAAFEDDPGMNPDIFLQIGLTKTRSLNSI